MDADCIVIGAGIVGAACAQALAAAGLDVLVLDDGQPGATAAGMGHLVAMDDNPAELALSSTSLAQWRDWAPRLPAACEARACGTLWIAADAEEAAEAERKQARLAGAGVASRWLDAPALRAAEPALRPGLLGALQVPGDGLVYAPAAAAWLLHGAGPRLRRERARALALEGDAVQLADGSRRRAPHRLLACGLHAAALCPDIALRPKKGHLLITDRYPGTVQHQLVELGYVKSAHHAEGDSVAFNVQARPTGQLLVGSSRQFDTVDPAVEPSMLARMLRRAIHYLPGLADLNAIRSWTGLRAATADGLPLLGAHPRHAGLWLALGHEGLGVTTAPASAALLAALVTGALPPLDPLPYAPARLLGGRA
ncbi:FAD-binding oxidoreductase [Pseudorhodoferax sp. Leaf265]|uniref:NAD(P)/FAD-dependent oxidoreductase n=1 Tax=Pseudorhodoferax sp. Leaf265 TaxID=1736315 RepID=UPI0006FB8A98|nr:FAD-dependent oxidoreductase [Pseudorhodoferax sp. Leaf265]KQP06249.1 D-amino acid oxidase [Pseudorhodoferax sp. Leaf265]